MADFRLDFARCPACGSGETACRLGCEGEKGIPEDAFVSLEKVISPLIDHRKAIGLTVPALIAHYDVCAKCGTRYCTRVEKQNIPIQFQPVPGSQPPPIGGRG